MHQISIGIVDVEIPEIKKYVDDIIKTCGDRGVELFSIGLPGPALWAITEKACAQAFFVGEYRGVGLYVQSEYPIASILEVVFVSTAAMKIAE